jgi:hypothetical protein
LSYINVIQPSSQDLGQIETFLKGWSGVQGHHLDPPEEARVTLTYLVPGVGIPPVRLYAEVSPAQLTTGERVLFFTLTVRGNPGGRRHREHRACPPAASGDDRLRPSAPGVRRGHWLLPEQQVPAGRDDD